MSRNKTLSVLPAMLLSAVFLVKPSLAVEAQPATSTLKPQTDAARANLPSATKPAARTIGKRPPRVAERPVWLGSIAGENVFLIRFGLAFDRLDKNKDGLVKWAVIDAQGKMLIDKPGPEPLPTSYDACYLIDYVYHPAKKDKDPAHPGQFIETPESYEITGWKTWKEALAQMTGGYPAMSPSGVCNKME